MQADFGGTTINGGWLVFAALVAVWVGLVVENRTKRLSALLEAALDETNELRPREARKTEAEPAKDSAGLAHLAAAVEQERQAGEPEREPAGESKDRV
jgi:hypothetical protein